MAMPVVIMRAICSRPDLLLIRPHLSFSSSYHLTAPCQRFDTNLWTALCFLVPQPHDLFPDVKCQIFMATSVFPGAEGWVLVVLQLQAYEEGEFDFGTLKGCEPVSCPGGFRTTHPASHRRSLNEPVRKGA